VLLTPPTLWLALLFLVPMGIMALFSFRAGTFGAERQIFSLAHYARFFENTSLLRLLWRSIRMAAQVGLFAVILAYPIAYFLTFRAGALRMTFLLLIIVPAWTSYLLRILAWKVLLGSQGVINAFLLWLGLIEKASPIFLYSAEAVVATLVYVWIPFTALPIFASLSSIDISLLEAASDLGCAPWEAFLRVTLPLSLPGVIVAFFFTFIPTIGEYVTPMLIGGATGVMYGNIISDQFTRAMNWPMGSVMSLVMLVIVLGLILVLAWVATRTRFLEL